MFLSGFKFHLCGNHKFEIFKVQLQTKHVINLVRLSQCWVGFCKPGLEFATRRLGLCDLGFLTTAREPGSGKFSAQAQTWARSREKRRLADPSTEPSTFKVYSNKSLQQAKLSLNGNVCT